MNAICMPRDISPNLRRGASPTRTSSGSPPTSPPPRAVAKPHHSTHFLPTASPVADQILAYTQFAQSELKKLGAEIHGSAAAEHLSGITSFTIPNVELAQLRSQCMDVGVVLSHRDGRLRISPHAYNNQEDLDRLLSLIRTCIR